MGIKRITAISNLSPYLEISGGLAKDIKFTKSARSKLYLGMTTGLFGEDSDGKALSPLEDTLYLLDAWQATLCYLPNTKEAR